MSDEARGLYRKFRVERTDGSSVPGGKHEDCRYFVLDLEHDEHAVPALQAYASAASAKYPSLARDLRAMVGIAAICVCIECGRCAVDEDGCCTTCGRDALLLEDGRLVNRDFADSLEADVRRQTAEAIAAWCAAPCPCDESDCESRYRALAAAIRRGDWRPAKSEVTP